MISIPKLADFETVLKIYYENLEIGNKEIITLFKPQKNGKSVSSATVRRLKNAVREEEIERGTPKWNAHRVNTKVAFDVWGIDIDDIERRKKKLEKLSLA